MTTAVLVAGGPSLTQQQVEMVTAAHAARRCVVGVVNNMWERFPSADVLYAADLRWWDAYWAAVQQGFGGECWTCGEVAARKYGLCRIPSRPGAGLSRDPDVVNEGGNSGHQLVNLFRHFVVDDAERHIVLVAFDMMRGPNDESHSYGDHPKNWGNASKPETQWAPHFDRLCADLIADGIRVTNCSLRTALKVAPRASVADVLGGL